MGSLALVNLTAPPSGRGAVLAHFYVVMYLGVGLPVIGVGFLSTWIGLYGAIAVFAGTVGVIGMSLVSLATVPLAHPPRDAAHITIATGRARHCNLEAK
jgi:hypothetical protein